MAPGALIAEVRRFLDTDVRPASWRDSSSRHFASPSSTARTSARPYQWYSAVPDGSTTSRNVVNSMLGRYRGALIKHTGDGVLATFDGPARGVKCAQAISDAMAPLGLEIRAGLHTGEIERRSDDLAVGPMSLRDG